MKKLASETKMREDSVSRFEKEKMEFEGRFNQLQKQAELYQQERDRMKEKLA